MNTDSDAMSAARLREAKRKLLERRLRGLSGAGGGGIPRRSADGPAPLSPAQHGVWLAEQLRTGPTLFGVYRMVWLRGRLDTAAFRAALDTLVARHEVLRTTYPATEDGPVQLVADAAPAPLTVAAAPGGTIEERRTEARRLAEEHLAVFRMHHLLTDEWSCDLLARELATAYAAHRQSAAPELPELPIRFGDYASWLAEPEQAAERRRQVAYWRDLLADVPPVLELPTDAIRPDEPSYRGGVVRRRLSTEVSTGLRALSAAHGATMFSTLLALFSVVLHRYSGQRRFAVGSLLSGRGRSEIESMLGLFASTVAVPVDLGGAPSFAELLARTGGTVTGALDNQDATFDQVLAELKTPREANRNPLFQVLFQCLEAGGLDWELAGLSCESVWMDAHPAKVDLTLIAINGPDAVELELTYATDLYREATAERLLDHLANIVDAAVADPHARITDVDMLTEDERHDNLVAWNDTAMEYPRATVHELFERWACENGDRVAIRRVDGGTVSYAELNRRANKTAHYLRAHGVGRETLVGVCMNHSVEMFVALLGVLKAGAAYVPLDAALPIQRMEWILEDTASPIVVTTESLRETIPDAYAGELLCVDTAWPDIDPYPDHDPEPLADADNLLYIIYTSGSTGRPKGVLVPHGGVVNYLWWAVGGYGLDGERGAPMLGSIAFDLSVPNFWLPLIGGKCVTLLPADQSLETLADVLQKPGDFSLLKITPGHLDVLRSMLEPGSVRSVRTFVVGADEVRPETVSGWRAVAPGARVINEYGPTETVVGCSIYTVPDDFDASVSVSIGKPIGNLRMYVLDEGLNQAPVGVTGELYIGGDGVARGYLHRPALTAEKFVPDPYGRPGDRLYRTGDLARRRADGDLEFLGRTDFQVKIRGYRIELGEVEARLGLHPEVTEAVAAAVTSEGGHKRLVGYVVAADPANPPAPAELRAFMAETLPEYMVPAVFAVLDAMPLTSAGKVDRTALPAPGATRPGFAEARTPEQRILAGIWSEVLGAAEVGIRDNFFELGGDSILAVKVVGRARAAGFELSPAALFRHQTVAELAAALGGPTAPEQASTVESPITAEPDEWERLLRELAAAPPPATDHPLGPDTPAATASVTREPAGYERLGAEDVLTAFARALTAGQGGVGVAVDLGGHPVVLRAEGSDPRAWAASLRAGLPTGTMPDASAVAPAQIRFTGTGTAVPEPAGYVLDVVAADGPDGPRLTWRYDPDCYDESTVDALADAFVRAAEAIAAGAVDGDRYPLSPLQALMLYQTAGDSGGADYQGRFVYALDGDLDAGALHRAWRLVTARHDALRTTFAWRGLPAPVQIVHAAAEPRWTVHDWRDVPAAELPERVHTACGAPLPLEDAPPVAMELIRTGENEHRLVWRFHHILLDGWSMTVVFEELMAAYRAYVQGGEPDLPAPVPFREHIAWLAGLDPAAARAHWRRALDGAALPTPIPAVAPDTDAPHADVRTATGRLPRAATERLTAFARANKVTPGTVAHAAWALLLAKESGTPDVVFGTVSAARSAPVPDIDRMVGLLMNTLPARVTVTDAPVGDWLRGVHAALGSHREHEHVSLSDIRRAAGIEGGRPLFESIFDYENFSEHDADALADAAGLRVRPLDEHAPTGYPLVVSAGLRDELTVELCHDRARVTDAEADRLLGAYLDVLTALMEPAAGIAALGGTTGLASTVHTGPSLSDSRRRPAPYAEPRTATEQAVARLWAEALGTDRVGLDDHFIDLGGDSILAMRIVAGAREEHIALRARDLFRSPTVRELAALAEAAPEDGASGTAAGGTGASETYPLTTMQAGMLFHTLYEPGGDDYHQQHVLTLTGDLDPELLTRAWRLVAARHAVLRSVFRWEDVPKPVQTVRPEPDIDISRADWSAHPDHEARLGAWLAAERARGFDLAAAPPHRFDLIRTAPDRHLLVWQFHHLQLDGWSTSSVLMEVFEAYESLRATGEAPAWPAAPRFGDYVAWQQAQDTAAERDHWRAELAGIGAATPVPMDRPDAPIEGTGSRETALDAERVARLHAASRAARVTVGALLHAAWALLLSRHSGHRDVMFGTTLAGRSADLPGIERMVGMLMTTLPFRVPVDPDAPLAAFLGEVHDRYITVRDHEHGVLTDVQRCSDIPVGRRMFDSIFVYENFTSAQPGVTGLDVSADGGFAQTGYPLLCAASLSDTLDIRLNYQAGRVTDATAERVLAEYAELLDRIAGAGGTVRDLIGGTEAVLPVAAASSAPEPAAAVPAADLPRNAAEPVVAGIIAKVLGQLSVGRHDDFFALGGDSILAIQVVSLARQAGLRFTLRDVFERRSAAGLAAAVATADGAGAEVDAEQGTVTGPVAPTPVQRWFTSLDVPHDHYNQAMLLRAGRPVDAGALETALHTLVAHHDALRTRLWNDEGTWRQEIAPEETATLVTAAECATDAERDAAATAAHASLDLRNGPLLRAVLQAPGTVLIAAHHLAVDNVSWRILLEDLETAYAAALDGRAAVLPAKTTSFQAWAARLAEYAGGAAFAPEAGYWRTRPTRSGDLPVDRATGADTEGATAVHAATLSEAATARLLRAAGHDVDTLLLAAVAGTLRDWTGRADIRFDVERHGREDLFGDADVSRTVGWFTTVAPVEVHLTDTGPATLVEAVGRSVRALPHRGIGHGLATSGERAGLVFNYHGRDAGSSDGGLFTPVDGPVGVARDPRGVRPYLVEVDAAVTGGRLRVEWKYAAGLLDAATVERVAEAFLAKAAEIAEWTGVPVTAPVSTVAAYEGSPALLLPMARHRVPGLSVAVMRGGTPAEAWAYGVRERGHGGAVSPDTPFRAGSVSKLVTAAGVLRLAEEGVLDLDGDVHEYADGWTLGVPVTARQLLTHTAGLTEAGYHGYAPGAAVPSLLDVLEGRAPASTPKVRVEYEPGTRRRYSGSHYTVLQLLVEGVTGEPFAEVMRQVVLVPAGMARSTFAQDGPVDDAAVAHDRDGDPYPERWRVIPESAAAGLWTTPGDLTALMAAVHGSHTGEGAFLSRQSVRLLRNGEGDAERGALIGYLAGAAGYQCLLLSDMDSGDGVVVMTNADSGRECLDEVSEAVLRDVGGASGKAR